MVTIQHVYQANERIRNFIRKTPLVHSPHFSRMSGAEVWLKLELQQVSGSFKIRGVLNKILQLEDRSKQFVAASTGNHGAAFAWACHHFGLNGLLFLPGTISSAKLDFIRSLGVHYKLFGKGSLEAEIHAEEYANKNDAYLVHPYADEEIIAGQGTVAIECLEQCPEVDEIIVPVGGGGLISGIGLVVKDQSEAIVTGVQPANSPEVIASIDAGKIVYPKTKPTLSDGTAGGMVMDSPTFPLCQKLVDNWLTISEEDIANEITAFIKHHQILVEGAAALSAAALYDRKSHISGKKVILVITGKRISLPTLRKILH